MSLIYSHKVSKAFADKVVDISDKLPASEPNWLMFIMGFETGWTFSPCKKNPDSSATGLIQFLEKTANWLGTTTEALCKMSAEDQLDYVYEYMKRRQDKYGRFASYYDVYFAVFYPEAIGQDDDFAIDRESSLSNLGFDLNKDKVVTVGEIKKKLDEQVLRYVPSGYHAEFFKKKTFCNYTKERLFLSQQSRQAS